MTSDSEPRCDAVLQTFRRKGRVHHRLQNIQIGPIETRPRRDFFEMKFSRKPLEQLLFWRRQQFEGPCIQFVSIQRVNRALGGVPKDGLMQRKQSNADGDRTESSWMAPGWNAKSGF